MLESVVLSLERARTAYQAPSPCIGGDMAGDWLDVGYKGARFPGGLAEL